MENREKSGFAHARLPWLIVVAALMVYVLTLNRRVSLASLAVVAGVANPEAALPLNAPLPLLWASAFRCLAVPGQGGGLHLFAAGCGGVAQGLLQRPAT